MKVGLVVLAVALVAAAGFAGSATAAAPVHYAHFVTQYGMSAKLEARYDFAYCAGIRRYGTRSVNSGQYGWTPGYIRFECSYRTLGGRRCFSGVFDSVIDKLGPKRWGNWYIRMVDPGTCYTN